MGLCSALPPVLTVWLRLYGPEASGSGWKAVGSLTSLGSAGRSQFTPDHAEQSPAWSSGTCTCWSTAVVGDNVLKAHVEQTICQEPKEKQTELSAWAGLSRLGGHFIEKRIPFIGQEIA